MVENDKKIWKKFLSNHWKILIVFSIIAAILVIGAIYVYLWFVGEAQSTALVPTTLNLWSMGHIITFIIHLIFWELIFIGIPAAIVAAAAYGLWWKRIPEKERKEYKEKNLFGKRSKRTDGEGAISFLIFIFFCIKVYLDGNWNVAIASWEFDYLVYSCLWALIWVLVIFGIPMLIGGLLWLNHEMSKK
jgi:hypothetical protein